MCFKVTHVCLVLLSLKHFLHISVLQTFSKSFETNILKNSDKPMVGRKITFKIL